MRGAAPAAHMPHQQCTRRPRVLQDGQRESDYDDVSLKAGPMHVGECVRAVRSVLWVT